MEYDKYLKTMPSHHLNLGRFRIFSFLSFPSFFTWYNMGENNPLPIKGKRTNGGMPFGSAHSTPACARTFSRGH